MRRNIFTTALLCGALVAGAQDLPKPSPLAKVEQRVGLTDITIEYSRPSAKGRVIFGDLVPYGKMWRTGANKNTMITFSNTVTLADSEVPAGTYSLFTIPGKDGDWKVILNSNTEYWGTGDYNAEFEVVTLDADVSAIDHVETFTMGVNSIAGDIASLDLMWEKTKVSLKLVAKSIEQAKKNIAAELAKDSVDFRAYNSSARYYVDNNLNLDKAAQWAKQSVEMEKRFWNVYTLSLVHAARKEYKEAINTAEMSMALAEEAEYEPYVKMNKENMAKWEKMLQ